MAYAALVSLEQTTALIMNPDKYSISADEKEKIISIRRNVFFLISLLEDSPQKANRLEGQIRDAANETEDIIGYFMWMQIQSRYELLNLSGVEFKLQLKKVTEEIGIIAGELKDDRSGGDLPAALSSLSLASASENDDTVIGVHDDLVATKDRLCGESSRLQEIPIVGMAGIGKTTLAKNAYDDPLIMEHFQIRAWVTVSQDYAARDIIYGLLDSMKLVNRGMLKQKDDRVVIAELVSKVIRSLQGKRYLLVIDDVWSTQAWDGVRRILPDDLNGSRIILTTRLSNGTAYLDSSSLLHEMQLMEENRSWNLLKHNVFTNSQDYCPPGLEDIGKEIARSCRGLPLAITVVAGVLSTLDRDPASWREIANILNPVVASREGQFKKILSMSYTRLPHHLRPCFLYMGGFPEDYKIHVSELIKLWAAEGFLRCRNESQSLEEVAEEYLKDLVRRGLVLVTSRKTNGKVKCCSLHDLVREFCIRKAQEDNFLLRVTGSHVSPESIRQERRVSISNSRDLIYLGPTVHTVISFQDEVLELPTSLAFVGNFRLLRVLDLVNDITPLPPQVFELFHLRYLALRNFVEIPAAISKLENLQTLIIHPRTQARFCMPFYSYLPPEIWRMPQLRHLIFFHFYALPEFPADGSALPLENLQTLSFVVRLIFSERILKMIPNLKKLRIICSESMEYHLHNLIRLHHLEKLKVTATPKFSWRGKNRPAFPRTLKKLTLVGGQVPLVDMTIIGSLPNLEVLKLRRVAYDGNTWRTSDGGFPQLKFLLIEESELQHWISESSHFPILKSLVLRQCRHLREIPKGIGKIAMLELIEVDDQNLSVVVSAKQIQKNQQENGNGVLQVRCIRHQAIYDPLKDTRVSLLAVERTYAPRQ